MSGGGKCAFVDVYKRQGLVILPMTVVKRFHDCLLPTHQAVLDTYEKVKKLQVIDGFLPVSYTHLLRWILPSLQSPVLADIWVQ